VSSDRVRQRLTDVIENIDRIGDHVGAMSFAEFERDAKTIDAVERCLQRITEAVIKIGPERMGELAPGLPVEKVRGMGNVLRHDYDLINLGVIWVAVTDDLPELRAACVRALDTLDSEAGPS
jgi:uncharacterized protein with HEPN domain